MVHAYVTWTLLNVLRQVTHDKGIESITKTYLMIHGHVKKERMKGRNISLVR